MPDLRLDLRNLKCAFTAAELGSFRRAAEALELPQSTVSRRVQLLEHRLGFPLFVRSRHGVRLTFAGANFLEGAQSGAHQLQRAAQAAAAVHRGDSGRLRVGILASFTATYLHNLFRRFRKQHSDLTVTFEEGTPHEILCRLSAGKIDVLFMPCKRELAGYEFKVLWTESMVVALHPTHRLAARDKVGWDDIKDEKFIVTHDECGVEIQNYIIRKVARTRSKPCIDVHDVSRDSLLDLVGLEYGITLTTMPSTPIGAEQIIFRPIIGETGTLPASAVWWPDNDNPALRLLLNLAYDLTCEGISTT